MKRSEAVLQGAPLVQALDEAAIEGVRAVAMTTVELIDLRRQANLCATVGSEAWKHLGAVSAAMHEGLISSIAFHKEMAEVKARIGCRTIDTGGKDKDDHDGAVRPQPMGAVASPDRLRVVG